MDTSIQKLGFDNDNAKTLLISFAGQGIGGNVGFEWVNFFKDRPVKAVSVRDCNRAYYMGDLFYEEKNIISKNIDSHAEMLSKIIDESQCDNVITTGASMGGYAAVLFGVLLNVNSILSYSAQTYIKDHKVYGRNERPHLVTYAYRCASEEDKQRYFDLTELDYSNFKGKIHYHWSVSWRDAQYVNHMKEFAKVYPRNKNNGDSEMEDALDIKVHEIEWRHAKLCKRLKDHGLLSEHFDKLII